MRMPVRLPCASAAWQGAWHAWSPAHRCRAPAGNLACVTACTTRRASALANSAEGGMRGCSEEADHAGALLAAVSVNV
jgi:hypothetical protein